MLWWVSCLWSTCVSDGRSMQIEKTIDEIADKNMADILFVRHE